MRIKKFTAATLKEGKNLILEDLGDDAVILSSRSVRNPDGGKDLVEIVAAIDEEFSKPEPQKQSLKSIPRARKLTKEAGGKSKQDEFMETSSQLFSEIDSLKDMMLEMSDNIKYKYTGVLGRVYGELYAKLRDLDFSEQFAMKITGKVAEKKDIHDIKKALDRAREIITEDLGFLDYEKADEGRHISVFIGPTGSGKTSTLVKVAVVNKLLRNPEILILSTDSYKIGGAEQLQTFSSIAGIPFKTVYTPEEIKTLLDREYDKDMVFIDTVGKSQKDSEHIEEISDIIAASEPDRTYLVVSSTISASTFKNVLDSFSVLNPNGIILTKIDEAETLGGIMETLLQHPIPMAYYTVGQKVPEDIEPANREKFGYLVIPEIHPDLRS